MSDWKEYRLGDVVQILDSKRIPLSSTHRQAIQGPYPYYGAQNIIDYINDYIFDGEFLILAEDGENLKSRKSPIAQIVRGKFWLNNHAHILKGNGKADLYFLNAILNCSDISGYITGSAQPKLNQENMSKIKVSLPPLSEQKRIAGILSALDEKIETNRKITARLEELARAIFKSWFIDYTPFGGHLPNNWKTVKLSELGEIVGGATPSKDHPEYYAEAGKGIAWLTPKDLSLSKAKFTAHGNDDISVLGYNKCSTKMIPSGSILFSSRAPIGYVSISLNEVCTNQGFKSFVPNKVGTAYAYYLLKALTPEIENKATGSTFKEASGSLMKELRVIYPNAEILSKFETICSPTFAVQRALEQESLRLAALRDALLPKLMSGEIKPGINLNTLDFA